MVLCRFLGVFRSEQMMSVRNVSVMSGLFVGALFVMLRRFPMMTCSVLVMVSGLLVMLRTLVFRHFRPSFLVESQLTYCLSL